jgi:hypothetical protein
MSTRKTWVEMSNGEILSDIPFVAWIDAGEARELRCEFTAPNPPMHHGDADLFKRLSFEGIRARFEAWGFPVDYIIRGECSESGVRDCYVYSGGRRVPFAVIRPAVFAR